MLRVHKISVRPGIFVFYGYFQAGSNLKMVGTVQLIKFRHLPIIAQHLLARWNSRKKRELNSRKSKDRSKIVWRSGEASPTIWSCNVCKYFRVHSP